MSIEPRTPASIDLVAAAARLGGLSPGAERLAELVPAMDGFFALLDILHRDDLGETPPAIAFQARWEQR